MIVRHLRDTNRRPFATVAFNDKLTMVGVAVWNPNFRNLPFSKKLGREIAVGRLDKAPLTVYDVKNEAILDNGIPNRKVWILKDGDWFGSKVTIAQAIDYEWDRLVKEVVEGAYKLGSGAYKLGTPPFDNFIINELDETVRENMEILDRARRTVPPAQPLEEFPQEKVDIHPE